MLLASQDIAPESGNYRVFGADGTLSGSVRVQKGGAMPPGVSAFDYYEYPDRQ